MSDTCKPTLENYPWDRSEYIVLPPNTDFYEIIRVLIEASKEKKNTQ